MKKIKKVNYENYYSNGCETCDYGSNYVSNALIIYDDNTCLALNTSQMYNYMLTEEDYMIATSNSANEEELVLILLNIIKEKSYDIEMRVRLEDMEFTINEKEIDIIKTLNNKKITYKK